MSSALNMTILACYFFSGSVLIAQSHKKQEREQLKEGKMYYEKYSCRSCHGDKGILQGDLTRAFEKYDNATLEAYIRNPHRFNNYKMPVYEKVIPQTAFAPLIVYIQYLGRQSKTKKN